MNKQISRMKANGKLPVKLGWQGAYHRFEITGGPFDAFAGFDAANDRAFGVCVRAERVPAGVDVHLPIHDFEVPYDKDQVEKALRSTLQAALDGKQVYVGCMGGWGRTGLFLALLAKVCGETVPVGYVRRHYSGRAVETEEQQEYVATFAVGALQHWLFWAAWNKRAFWWR